jgi:hypothetical protein
VWEAERQAAVAAAGRVPLDVMLENMRWADKEAAELRSIPYRGAPRYRSVLLVTFEHCIDPVPEKKTIAERAT